MIYRTTTRDGRPPCMRAYTVGGTAAIAVGTPVTLTDDTIGAAGDGATALLGILQDDVTAAQATSGTFKANVMEFNDNLLFEISFTDGSPRPANPLYSLYGLKLANEDYSLNLGDADTDMLKLVEITRDGTATNHESGDLRCWACVPSSKSQAMAVEA